MNWYHQDLTESSLFSIARLVCVTCVSLVLFPAQKDYKSIQINSFSTYFTG